MYVKPALAAQLTAVGVPVGNVVTNDGIITALSLESMVFLGMTYGAWFKIVALLSLLVVVIINFAKLGVYIFKLFGEKEPPVNRLGGYQPVKSKSNQVESKPPGDE